MRGAENVISKHCVFAVKHKLIICNLLGFSDIYLNKLYHKFGAESELKSLSRL